MQVEDIPVELVVKNSWNPNAMPAAAFDRLVQEIKDVGFLDPVQVVPMEDGTYRLLGGEHRVEAVKSLGWTTVPAIVLSESKWQDEELQKLVTVRLNVLKGKLDPSRMAALYDEMAEKHGEEALKELFAYTDSGAWKKMISSIGKGLKQSGMPDSVVAKFMDQAKEKSALEDLGKILNMLFSEFGDTVQQNFMVFTYGGSQHLYVAVDSSMWKTLSRVTRFCREYGVEINEFMRPVLDEMLAKTREEAKTARKATNRDDVVASDDVDF